jgi:hypothetical protein
MNKIEKIDEIDMLLLEIDLSENITTLYSSYSLRGYSPRYIKPTFN